MSNEEDYDLYDDLDDVLLASSSPKEISKNDNVREEQSVKYAEEKNLAEINEKMKILQEELEQTIRKKDTIESNMSVLLLTCKKEIERFEY